MTANQTIHILISGRVRGVGFRAWMRREAHGLGLAGWVRNTQDGQVEAIVCGPPADIETMIDACKRGPKWARVEHIEQQPAADFAGAGFTVQSTS